MIGIDFHLKGRGLYAFRRWPAVPRVGDVVMLHDPERDPKGELRYPAVVRLIAWGIREESWAGKELECVAYIEWATGGEVAIPWGFE